jgi:hypothetical protein
VVDGDGVLLGVVTARALEREAGDPPTSVGAISEEVPELHPDQPLALAVDWLASGEREGLPVFAPGSSSAVGWVDHREVLRAYARGRRREPALTAPTGR